MAPLSWSIQSGLPVRPREKCSAVSGSTEVKRGAAQASIRVETVSADFSDSTRELGTGIEGEAVQRCTVPATLEGDLGMWVPAEPGHPGAGAPRRGAGLQRGSRQGGHGFVLPHRRTEPILLEELPPHEIAQHACVDVLQDLAKLGGMRGDSGYGDYFGDKKREEVEEKNPEGERVTYSVRKSNPGNHR
jgi:hypothetical protein